MSTVAALFVRQDSVYKTMPGVDCYDAERDALTWPGGMPCVAHPPCRSWGRLRQFSHGDADEKALALWAIDQVRAHGGVLEHPASSTLWHHAKPSLIVEQRWWGHRAPKRTGLYIWGCDSKDWPEIPMLLGDATHCIRPTKSYPRLPSVTKPEREKTPPAFAQWLVELARRCA